MINKQYVIPLTVILLFALCTGCGSVVPDPTTDPTTAPTTEPITEPTTEPITEPTTEPITEPTTEPTTEPATDPSTEPTVPLSMEEQFQSLLSYDGDYWLWRILGCTFEEPQDISLEHLLYNGLRHDERESRDDYSEGEVAFLRDFAKDSFWKDEEAWVNALKIPASYLTDVLTEYLGLSPDQITIPEDWRYFEETDAYYSLRTDGYGVSGHTVTEVTMLEDGTVQVCWTVDRLMNTLPGEFMENPEMVLTLRQEEDGSYQALSNQPKEGDAHIAPQ